MLSKELVNYQGKLFYVYRRFKETHVKTDRISELRDLLGCDIVLKQNNTNDKTLIFLREIKDAEVLEFIPNKR